MFFIAQVVNLFFQFYTLALLARILASWFPDLFQYRWMQFLVYMTDPYLNVFRRFIPPFGMIDFSPVIAFICLGFIQNLVVQFLLSFVK